MLNNGKAKIEKTFNEINISIPSKKNWFLLLFATTWLGGWYFGFIKVSSILVTRTGVGAADGFLTFWLIAWTLGGFFFITVLLWGYFGKEKVTLERGEVLFEKSVFSIGPKQRLQALEIKNIRTEISNGNLCGGNRWAVWGLGPGNIKFDYGLKTFSFGLSVDDAEADHIATLLKGQIKN